ncbi:MAG: response regulator [Magnetovibrionaceae bacterium]
MGHVQKADLGSRVLVVDDYDTMRKVWQRQLRNLGFGTVEIAADVYQAAERVRQGDFDLIISDWKMKPVSGVEFLKMIRDCDQGQAIKFLMITEGPSGPSVDESMEAGADAFLPKPFNEAKLAASLDALFS